MKRNNLRFLWPQICYDAKTAQPIRLVFEKNNRNRSFIYWPVVSLTKVPVTNIDFTGDVPLLNDGNPWDYQNWHRDVLDCEIMSQPNRSPEDFWDWRSMTRPQGNLGCDLDFLFENSGKFAGIEATEIYYVNEDQDINRDVYHHFVNLFVYRKGGFNIRQLKAQKALLDKLGGSFYMLFHQINSRQVPYFLNDKRTIKLLVDDEVLLEIQNLIDTKSLTASLKTKIEFLSMEDAINSIIELG